MLSRSDSTRSVPVGVHASASEHAAVGRPLGKLTKYCPTPATGPGNRGLEIVRETTGEVVHLSVRRGKTVEAFDPVRHRTNLYSLQRSARLVLPRSEYIRGRDRPHRVHHCLWTALGAEGASIWRNPESGSSHFGNLMVCGQIWSCPICAAKVANRRSELLDGLLRGVTDRGGATWHVTLTFAHGPSDALADQLSALLKARNLLHRRRSILRAKRSQGFVGYASALEITHGANGWHPHLHELWLCDRPLVPGSPVQRSWAQELSQTWQGICVGRGLGRPSLERGCLVQGGDSAAKYLAKEVTHLVTKKAAPGGRTSWQILGDAATDEDSRNLWREYIRATHGRHHIQMSHGLMDSAPSDSELAVAQIEEAELLGIMSKDEWTLVRNGEHRASVLTLSESGWGVVQRFLDSLTRSASGRIPA